MIAEVVTARRQCRQRFIRCQNALHPDSHHEFDHEDYHELRAQECTFCPEWDPIELPQGRTCSSSLKLGWDPTIVILLGKNLSSSYYQMQRALLRH